MTTSPAIAPPVGATVLSWLDADPVTYGGPDPARPEAATLKFQLFGGQAPTRYCRPDWVAPADTPTPAADPRVTVVKLPRKPAPWAAGNWELRIDTGADQLVSHFATKREATATGLRRVAILDHVAARDTA